MQSRRDDEIRVTGLTEADKATFDKLNRAIQGSGLEIAPPDRRKTDHRKPDLIEGDPGSQFLFRPPFGAFPDGVGSLIEVTPSGEAHWRINPLGLYIDHGGELSRFPPREFHSGGYSPIPRDLAITKMRRAADRWFWNSKTPDGGQLCRLRRGETMADLLVGFDARPDGIQGWGLPTVDCYDNPWYPYRTLDELIEKGWAEITLRHAEEIMHAATRRLEKKMLAASYPRFYLDNGGVAVCRCDSPTETHWLVDFIGTPHDPPEKSTHPENFFIDQALNWIRLSADEAERRVEKARSRKLEVDHGSAPHWFRTRNHTILVRFDHSNPDGKGVFEHGEARRDTTSGTLKAFLGSSSWVKITREEAEDMLHVARYGGKPGLTYPRYMHDEQARYLVRYAHSGDLGEVLVHHGEIPEGPSQAPPLLEKSWVVLKYVTPERAAEIIRAATPPAPPLPRWWASTVAGVDKLLLRQDSVNPDDRLRVIVETDGTITDRVSLGRRVSEVSNPEAIAHNHLVEITRQEAEERMKAARDELRSRARWVLLEDDNDHGRKSAYLYCWVSDKSRAWGIRVADLIGKVRLNHRGSHKFGYTPRICSDEWRCIEISQEVAGFLLRQAGLPDKLVLPGEEGWAHLNAKEDLRAILAIKDLGGQG